MSRRPARTTVAVASVAALVLSGCGGGPDRKAPRIDAFSPIEQRVGPRNGPPRAAPRWVRVTRLAGRGPASERVSIAGGAIQWRARWRCRSGSFRLFSAPGSAGRRPLDKGRCPGRGEAQSIGTGSVRLSVEASGPWQLQVDQQVDTPIAERPLPAMRSPAARLQARGAFYGIERRAKGEAQLHRLPGGRLALRLDGFETSPNVDLFVWTSPVARPRTSRQAFRAPHSTVAELKSTAGSQNYLLPRGTSAREIRSVIIWCEPVQIAYAAAALTR